MDLETVVYLPAEEGLVLNIRFSNTFLSRMELRLLQRIRTRHAFFSSKYSVVIYTKSPPRINPRGIRFLYLQCLRCCDASPERRFNEDSFSSIFWLSRTCHFDIYYLEALWRDSAVIKS